MCKAVKNLVGTLSARYAFVICLLVLSSFGVPSSGRMLRVLPRRETLMVIFFFLKGKIPDVLGN